MEWSGVGSEGQDGLTWREGLGGEFTEVEGKDVWRVEGKRLNGMVGKEYMKVKGWGRAHASEAKVGVSGQVGVGEEVDREYLVTMGLVRLN